MFDERYRDRRKLVCSKIRAQNAAERALDAIEVRVAISRREAPGNRVIERSRTSAGVRVMLRDGADESVGASEHGVSGSGGGEHGEKCDRLHRKLKRIVKARAALDLEEAAALREAQQLVLWRRYGYASLLEYMEREMGYSPRAALERLRVAKAIVELPQLAAAMEQGDLSFSGVRELTRVATPETEEKWIESAKDMNLRELEDSVSGHKRGDLPEDSRPQQLHARSTRGRSDASASRARLRQGDCSRCDRASENPRG
jgi:hypothetical protein